MRLLNSLLAFVFLASVDIIMGGLHRSYKNLGNHISRIMEINPKLSDSPRFASTNFHSKFDNNEQKLLADEYASIAPTTGTTAQEDSDDDTNRVALPIVRSIDIPQSGRTFKHLVLLRALLGSGAVGSSNSGNGGAVGGFTIPYIIINQPMNFTNQNNNSLINMPPVTTTTRRRRDVPLQYIPVPNTAASFRPTPVYHKRQSDEDHIPINIALPLSAASAMFGLSTNDFIPIAPTWPNINNIQIQEHISHRKTPFNRFVNSLKGIQYL